MPHHTLDDAPDGPLEPQREAAPREGTPPADPPRGELHSGIVASGVVRRAIEEREEALSPFAVRSRDTRGRQSPEGPRALRTAFQVDRDRILHSNAFRRLKHKTQVFIAPMGDHYVTRLTHALEVAQIGRTIARALGLNEDLVEAIALGHDLGHTPFGHVGEDELGRLLPGGFRHSLQSLRIVDCLERDGQGLNLTWEVRQGIAAHSKPRGDFLDTRLVEGMSLEAQACRVADAIAYLDHDLGDAFRAGVLSEGSLPPQVTRILGSRHSQRVDAMICDVVETSWDCRGGSGVGPGAPPPIAMSPKVGGAVIALREFMFENVYLPEAGGPEAQAARAVIRLLHGHFSGQRQATAAGPSERAAQRAVADHVAGMTDRYAVRLAEEINPGIAGIFRSRLL